MAFSLDVRWDRNLRAIAALGEPARGPLLAGFRHLY